MTTLTTLNMSIKTATKKTVVLQALSHLLKSLLAKAIVSLIVYPYAVTYVCLLSHCIADELMSDEFLETIPCKRKLNFTTKMNDKQAPPRQQAQVDNSSKYL